MKQCPVFITHSIASMTQTYFIIQKSITWLRIANIHNTSEQPTLGQQIYFLACHTRDIHTIVNQSQRHARAEVGHLCAPVLNTLPGAHLLWKCLVSNSTRNKTFPVTTPKPFKAHQFFVVVKWDFTCFSNNSFQQTSLHQLVNPWLVSSTSKNKWKPIKLAINSSKRSCSSLIAFSSPWLQTISKQLQINQKSLL